VNNIVSQALLLILTVALFLSLIVAPVMNTVNIFSKAPSHLWNHTGNVTSGFQWLNNEISKIFFPNS
jgi:hypothetical protein